MPSPREVFARTVLAFQPYAAEIVFIGGWVHALYLAEASSREEPVYTTDIDVTIPHHLPLYDRPALLDLTERAGFEVEALGEAAGEPVLIRQTGPTRDSIIDLDLLTEAPDARRTVVIDGQPDLAVQGYPGQDLLLRNARWMEVGPDIHPLLDPPRRIRVPTISAYVLQKAVSSTSRTRLEKQAKDLVYVFEILRHPALGADAMAGMAALAAAYPAEYRRGREGVERLLSNRFVLREAASQLILSNRAQGGETQVEAAIAARLRRFLGETPGPA